jgi:hypothetical protein
LRTKKSRIPISPKAKKSSRSTAGKTTEGYLESSYVAIAKLYDRVPIVTHEGMEVQIKDAMARRPGAKMRYEDVADESLVRELEKNGFIDKVYGRQ